MSGRHCCDGLCTKGYTCPSFAPGVIDGPFRRRRRWVRLLRALLTYLTGPTP